ncbi:MAG: sulfotransferase family 2 domain-containing protein [Lentilitoribacter sp.]
MSTPYYSPQIPVFQRPKENMFFFHIPKTAGTSVNAFFKKRYARNFLVRTPFSEVKPYWPNTGIYKGGHLDWDAFSTYPIETKSFTFLRDPFKLIESTYYFVKNSPHNTEDMTEASKRTRKYNFKDWLKFVQDGGIQNEANIDTEKHLEPNSLDNLYARCFLGRLVTSQYTRLPFDKYDAEMKTIQKRLETFSAVGIVEDFDNSLISICRACNVIPPAKDELVIKNQASATQKEQRDKVDDETLELLHSITVLDRDIYQFGKQLFLQQAIDSGLDLDGSFREQLGAIRKERRANRIKEKQISA